MIRISMNALRNDRKDERWRSGAQVDIIRLPLGLPNREVECAAVVYDGRSVPVGVVCQTSRSQGKVKRWSRSDHLTTQFVKCFGPLYVGGRMLIVGSFARTQIDRVIAQFEIDVPEDDPMLDEDRRLFLQQLHSGVAHEADRRTADAG